MKGDWKLLDTSARGAFQTQLLSISERFVLVSSPDLGSQVPISVSLFWPLHYFLTAFCLFLPASAQPAAFLGDFNSVPFGPIPGCQLESKRGGNLLFFSMTVTISLAWSSAEQSWGGTALNAEAPILL